jgi:transposase
VVDAQGVPLAIQLTAANVNEVTRFESLLEAIEPIKRPLGRPRKRPAKVHADKAYAAAHCRAYLRRYGIACRIARKGIESSERLGRHRWVVERTLAWLSKCRALLVRYDKHAENFLGLIQLACGLLWYRRLHRLKAA